ncbi:MAG: caspase family protein [Bacteroidales bacterium]|nr:caspase family protein [Bacteroidales bacterium]
MKIRVLIILAFVLLAPTLARAQAKRALVIGIGEQKDSAWNKINGDKDVPFVLNILNSANYKQIITCVNEEATKAGIVSAFQSLAQSCGPNDIIYIHYSGHGQQMRDISNDETDTLDECWIPYDAYRKPSDTYRGEKHLVDDEVNALLTNIRNKIGAGGKMLVVVDACHSGDATRGQGETVRGVEDIFETVKSLWGLYSNKNNANIHSNAERWITLSACKSNQVNIEMKSPTVGKLTYAIYTIIKDKEFENNNRFFKQLRQFINGNTGSRPQRPTMTGETTKYNISDILR